MAGTGRADTLRSHEIKEATSFAAGLSPATTSDGARAGSWGSKAAASTAGAGCVLLIATKKKCFSIGVRVTRGTRGPSQPAQSRGGAQHGTSSLPQPDPDDFAGAGAAPVPATSLTQSHGASFAAVGSKRCSRKNSGLMSASAAMERQGLQVN